MTNKKNTGENPMQFLPRYTPETRRRIITIVVMGLAIGVIAGVIIYKILK